MSRTAGRVKAPVEQTCVATHKCLNCGWNIRKGDREIRIPLRNGKNSYMHADREFCDSGLTREEFLEGLIVPLQSE